MFSSNSDGCVCLHHESAMATVRGVPDWIWLSWQLGWARQMRTRCPSCVWVCMCVCLQLKSEVWILRMHTDCPWKSEIYLKTLCALKMFCVGVYVFWSMRIWRPIWSCVTECGGGTQALSYPKNNNKSLCCIRSPCVVWLSKSYMTWRKKTFKYIT